MLLFPSQCANGSRRETPVGYALLKAKSSKILKETDYSGRDASAEEICNLYDLCTQILELFHLPRAPSHEQADR